MAITEIVLVRHAETDWSASGKHTSITDVALNAGGTREAQQIGALLVCNPFDATFTSPLRRAHDTAILAGYSNAQTDTDLSEWHYGAYESKTSADIHQTDPDWDIFRCGAPHGETAQQVTDRCDRLLASWAQRGYERILCFSHGHLLRALATRWIAQPIALGACLDLDPGSISRLGWRRRQRVLRLWNYAPYHKLRA
ncbi:histidine phosphatase family protein [Acidiferrobacter thiooxydans]